MRLSFAKVISDSVDRYAIFDEKFIRVTVKATCIGRIARESGACTEKAKGVSGKTTEGTSELEDIETWFLVCEDTDHFGKLSEARR